MNVPPVIVAQANCLPAQVPPPLIADRIPPIIEPQHRQATTAVPQPPLPEEALHDQLVNGCLSSVAAALEKDRRKAEWYPWISLACGLVFLFGCSLCVSLIAAIVDRQAVWEQTPGNTATLIAWGVIALAVLSVTIGAVTYGLRCVNLARGARQQYCAGYKEKVLTAAMRLLNPTFQYLPRGGISYQRFQQSRMFQQQAQYYFTEDYVRGQQGATAFEFAEVRAGYEVSHLLQKEKEYRAVFYGLYFIADFNKHFSTSVLVLPRTEASPGLESRLFHWSNSNRGRIVHLEDPDFEREFVVYAEDEIEVRYLLDPALMQRILGLQRIQRQPVSLSLFQEQLHIALSGTQDLFEPNPGCSTYSVAQIRMFLDQVRGVLSIIDLLHLNTRIWSKRSEPIG